MSHRFVRCPHCKMPHDAAERVCPQTGLGLAAEGLSAPRHAPNASRQREPAGQRNLGPKAPNHEPRDVVAGEFERALVGRMLGGRYRIKSVLGEGGMGTVFDAEHLGLTRDVAVKVLSPAQAKKRVAVKRFQQEARAAGAIGHPNICEVYDLGLLEDGSPYLVMEKLVGQTLAERIAREGGLPLEDVIDVMTQVLSGLVAAHEKGIVHRDIKPENIFLARRIGCAPIVKLLDFGVSKMMPEFQTGDDALDLTRTGMVMGTPYYMSPEQARGERNLDGRVDVYAAGVVMYEALAGRRPFLAPNYNALLLAIISTSPQPLRELRPDTPAGLEAIIERAMTKDRAERYPSAKAFLRELKPATSDTSAARVPPPPTAEERKRAVVLGGKPAVRASSHAPSDHDDSPGALLRRRMAEPESRRDENTRIERRGNLTPPTSLVAPPGHDELSLPPLAGSMSESDDAISIPIHFRAVAEAHDDTTVVDDATHIFRPNRHAPAAPRSPSKRSEPNVVDEWDGETVVRSPEHAHRPPAANRAAPRSFTPEETLRLDRADLEGIDPPPSPRPRRR